MIGPVIGSWTETDRERDRERKKSREEKRREERDLSPDLVAERERGRQGQREMFCSPEAFPRSRFFLL